MGHKVLSGLEMNAVFAVAGKIPNIFNLALYDLQYGMQESASIAVSDNDKHAYYSKVFNTFLRSSQAWWLLLIAATPILFKILIKGSYAEPTIRFRSCLSVSFFPVSPHFLGACILPTR